MAGIQPARVRANETTEEFMERRRRETAQRETAEAAGRNAWATSTTNGQYLSAPQTADIVFLGTQYVGARAPHQDTGVRYGSLYAPPPENLSELRRQQAQFADTRRDIANQNSWMAIPALAPAAVVFGLEGAAVLAARAAGPKALTQPLNFAEREVWRRVGKPLTEEAKKALRLQARSKLERTNGISTSDMQAEVHHSDPLQWAHLKPNADPNRTANLWALRGEAHDIATRAWTEFSKALRGRTPTQAELMEAKLRIDRLVEPYIRRAGVPRSNRPPRKGGPI